MISTGAAQEAKSGDANESYELLELSDGGEEGK